MAVSVRVPSIAGSVFGEGVERGAKDGKTVAAGAVVAPEAVVAPDAGVVAPE